MKKLNKNIVVKLIRKTTCSFLVWLVHLSCNHGIPLANKLLSPVLFELNQQKIVSMKYKHKKKQKKNVRFQAAYKQRSEIIQHSTMF